MKWNFFWSQKIHYKREFSLSGFVVTKLLVSDGDHVYAIGYLNYTCLMWRMPQRECQSLFSIGATFLSFLTFSLLLSREQQCRMCLQYNDFSLSHLAQLFTRVLVPIVVSQQVCESLPESQQHERLSVLDMRDAPVTRLFESERLRHRHTRVSM